MALSLSIRLGLASNSGVSILGSAQVGDTLSLSALFLTGASPITYSVQWERNGTNIAGATSASYTTQAADVGTSVSATVTLPGGSTLASVNAVSVLAATGTLPTTLTIMTMGQSNACDRATWTSAVFPADTHQLAWGNTALTAIDGAHNLNYSEGSNGAKVGMWPFLANALRVAAPTQTLHFVPASHGQTDFATGDWDNGGPQFVNAQTQSARYLAAEGRNIDLVAFMGHEFDGQNHTYDMELWNLYGTQLRDGTTFAGIDASTTLLMGYVRAATPSGGNDNNVAWVNACNDSVVARLTNAGVYNSWQGSTMIAGDDYHFDETSVAANAVKLAAAIPAAQAKTAPSATRVTAFDEWVLGSDNAAMLGVSGGNALTTRTHLPTHNSGYLALGTGNDNGLVTGFSDRATMTFAAMVLPVSGVSGGYFSIGLTGDPELAYGAAGSLTTAFASNPFTNASGGYTPSAAGFTLLVCIINSDPSAPWSGIYFVTSAGIVGHTHAGFSNLRAPVGGEYLALGKTRASGTNYNAATGFAWAGAWDGAMHIHEMRDLYARLTGTTLAGRGLTFV